MEMSEGHNKTIVIDGDVHSSALAVLEARDDIDLVKVPLEDAAALAEAVSGANGILAPEYHWHRLPPPPALLRLRAALLPNRYRPSLRALQAHLNVHPRQSRLFCCDLRSFPSLISVTPGCSANLAF